jgi:hypothetical protein
MVEISRISLFICILLILNVWTFNITNGENNIQNWNDFISDYEDSDNDGELDNFKSLDPGDGPFLIDEIVSYTDYEELGTSEIILKSNQNTPLLFGNTLGDEYKAGDKIWIYFHIYSAKEADGDPCENFDVMRITIFYEEEVKNGDNEIPKSNATTSIGGWLIICLVPLIPLLIVIYFIVLRPFLRDRKVKPEFELPVQTHTNQMQICPVCYQNTTYIPQYQKWHCHNCDKYL